MTGWTFRGFCGVYVKHHKRYIGRNPKTGKPMEVAAKKLPFLRRGKELKDRADHEQTTTRMKAHMKQLKKDFQADVRMV